MRLFTTAITELYPFDENGPALALYAMLKGILQTGCSKCDEITIELLVGMSGPRYLRLNWHPFLEHPNDCGSP